MILKGEIVQNTSLIKEPIDKPLEAKTFKGMYGMHKYWAKKPYNVVGHFIENFTNEGEIILDPFCGYGVSVSEALKLRRKAIGIDLNPMATFITKMVSIPVDLKNFQVAFENIKLRVQSEINNLYETKCPKCGKKATTTHVIWEKEAPKKFRVKCDSCNTSLLHKITKHEINKIELFDKTEIPFWYPNIKLFKNSRINVSENTFVSDLFSKRNLITLSILYNEIEKLPDSTSKAMLKFTFTGALGQASKMVFVIKKRGKMEGKNEEIKEEVGSWVAGYWVPKDHFEINVWNCFESRYRRVLKGKKESNKLIDNYFKEASIFSDIENSHTVMIKTQSSENLSKIPDNSIHYIFTDPPHGDRQPYMELSYMWASWLKFEPDFDDEIVISDSHERNKTNKEYREGLNSAFLEMYRVLKPTRYMSVAFNNLGGEAWYSFISSCFNAGFQKINVLPVKASAASVVQDSRVGGLKTDLIVTFKKNEKKHKPIVSKKAPEELIVSTANKLLKKNGELYSYELLDGIVTKLIDCNLIHKYEDIKKILNENFKLIDKKWKLG